MTTSFTFSVSDEKELINAYFHSTMLNTFLLGTFLLVISIFDRLTYKI